MAALALSAGSTRRECRVSVAMAAVPGRRE